MMKSDSSTYHIDQSLVKIFECLSTEFAALPHFVLSYRILKLFSQLSRQCCIRVISMIRTLRSSLISSESSKVIYCTFIECLLIELFSSQFSRMDTLDFKDISSELADCQVYVDLFENGEVSALNKSFGDSHFEFDLDLGLITRTYKNSKVLSSDEIAKLSSEFTPSTLEIKGISEPSNILLINFLERSIRSETKQLLSFEDSFKSNPNRNAELSSKRSLLSLNLGSTSSRSVKVSSPKINEGLYVRYLKFIRELLFLVS